MTYIINDYEWSTLDTVAITLCCLVILLHTFGMLIISKTLTREQLSENIELISVSFSTIMIAITYLIYISVNSVKPNIRQFLAAPVYTVFIPFYGSLIILTLQRFSAIYHHLHFNSCFIYRRRFQLLIALYIFAGVFLGMNMILHIFATKIAFYIEKTVTTIGILATNIISMFVYTYIFVKYKKATQEEKKNFYCKRKVVFFLPFTIYITLLLFGTLPYMFHSYLPQFQWVAVFFGMDGFSNSIIYLFLHPILFQRFKAFWRKHFPSEDNNNSLENSQSQNNTDSTAVQGESQIPENNDVSTLQGASYGLQTYDQTSGDVIKGLNHKDDLVISNVYSIYKEMTPTKKLNPTKGVLEHERINSPTPIKDEDIFYETNSHLSLNKPTQQLVITDCKVQLNACGD